MAKSDKLPTESYKGVRDFYPEEQAFLNYFFATCRGVVEKAGYVEYHASVLEPAELYKAKGAENEEMVSEQTYTFTDRGGREVTLRPEMTPTVARMVAAKRREMGFPLRLYSIPNVFRYERPQRGRLREHWQLNVDLFGSRSLYADAEIVGVAYGIMKAFGAEESDFVIKINSREHLNDIAEKSGLDEAKKTKLFALLDRKEKISKEAFGESLAELGVSPEAITTTDAPAEIQKMIGEFAVAGIGNIVFDPFIVRGFNYYTGMVFEVFDTHRENNRALFGGGRYDNLTALFDDEPLPGVGFGMGDVTMRDFLAVRGLLPPYEPSTKVYVAITSPELAGQVQALAGFLREQGVNVAVDFGEKKLGDQIKAADKHKIPFVLVVGPDELASGRFTVKELSTGTEHPLEKEKLAEFFLALES
jgi:histidyl-tRNA synthetase